MPKRAAGPCTSIALCPASRSNESLLVQPFVRATARYDLQRVVDAISTIGGDDIELERWHGQLRGGVRAQLGPMIQFTMSGGYLSFLRPGVSAWEARAFLTARFSAQMSGYGPGRGSAALSQRLGVSGHDRCRRHHQSGWASRCRLTSAGADENSFRRDAARRRADARGCDRGIREELANDFNDYSNLSR